MADSLRTKVVRGDRLVMFAVSRVFHHNLVQMAAFHGGFDGFWIDVEHAGLTTRDVELATLAGRASGFDTFVRIPPTDYALVTRCLEAGAGGVMAAQIESAEHAEQFMQWAKFVPRGRRGLNVGGFDGHFGLLPPAEFCERANEETMVAIQIETLGALNDCDAIAAIDGVDLLFVGPADLSQALGVTGQFLHAKCLDAIERVSAACGAHGKHWGAVTPTPEHAAICIEKGCTLISPTNDVRIVNAGLKAVQQSFAAVFERPST
jgi:2-dehydro-3-deoxyglucarate aldolase/4-hydroxy-2-oxoheptanedioate aldolase